MAWEELTTNKRGGNHVLRDKNPRSVVVSKHKSHNGKFALVLRITEPLAREARLMIGDRAKLLFDWDLEMGLVKRVQHSGYKFTPSRGRSKVREGSYSEGVIKVVPADQTIFDRLFAAGETSFESKSAAVTDSGIAFELAGVEDQPAARNAAGNDPMLHL